MYCNACGKAIAEDGRFCSYCGNVVGIPPTPKKLMRLRYDRKIAGVCSGLAHYLDLDVSLVRILWFFITLACGIFPGSWPTCSDGSSFRRNRFYYERQRRNSR